MTSTDLSRRGFLGSGAALGLTATASGLLLPAGARAQDAPRRGGHLRLGLNGGATTDSLDTATYSGTVLFTIGKTFGDWLVDSDPVTGAPLPAIAESWTASADAAEWRFRIRKGIVFHDGSPMTVADCAQTIRRHSDANSKSGALGLLSGIDRIEEDGDELVIGLSEGNADLPLLLTDYHLLIQPNGGFDNPESGIGTGPYRLVSYDAGVLASFERNPDYWRDDRGWVDSVDILTINDNTARTAALVAGQVHFISMVDPKTVDLLKPNPRVQILQTPGKGFYCFLAHCDTAPFDNNDLRMALKLAIDRQDILDRVLGGFGSIGNDYPVNGAYALAPEGIEQRTYDPEQAAFHYKKSGHEGPILLRTSDAAFPGAVEASTLYQQHALAAGIDLQIQREPDDGYWTDVWNVKPFCASYWGGRPTQDARYTTNFVSDAEWNDTRFMRPDFDALIVAARAELDEDKRRRLYHAAAVMVRDEGGLILPVFNDYLNAAQTSMKGWVDDIGNDISNGFVASRVWLEE